MATLMQVPDLIKKTLSFLSRWPGNVKDSQRRHLQQPKPPPYDAHELSSESVHFLSAVLRQVRPNDYKNMHRIVGMSGTVIAP